MKYQIGTLIWLEKQAKKTVGVIVDIVDNDYVVRWCDDYFYTFPFVSKYSEYDIESSYPLVGDND